MFFRFIQIVKPWYVTIASLASIVSLIIVFFNETYAIVTALVTVCVFLIILLVAIIRVVNKFIKKSSPEEYSKKSSFCKYETYDGVNIVFETYRHIQAKCLILTEFPYNFKWSGSVKPIIDSKLQTINSEIIDGAQHDYDKIILKFKRPLFFNETGVVHFHATCNDIDQSSCPFLEVKVDSPIAILHHRIIFGHKDNDFSENAIISRKKIITSIASDYEDIESIPFSQNTKSYEYHLINPEVGYFYRIKWN